ncbi:hypothetical protein AB0I51_46850 [Streptomyces sp. NPDC050549]|uniref:three-helix bundle dimerization domain-containing protein n=1 Tax=Streptomyces sp. NPDC050549 TaxID=3155406 RepID=UPI00342FC7F4
MAETPYGIRWLSLPVRQAAIDEPGGHCPDTRPAARPTPAAERHGREDVQARLSHDFPDASAAATTAAAAEAFAFFSSARIRHYVPVLAFKRASRRLAHHLPEPEARGG